VEVAEVEEEVVEEVAASWVVEEEVVVRERVPVARRWALDPNKARSIRGSPDSSTARLMTERSDSTG
jgi:hypothetical protein